MSIEHYIKTKVTTNPNDIDRFLKKLLPSYTIKMIRYSGAEFLYYVDMLSTKGVNIEKNHKGHVIRNTVFSNKADMQLTNALSTILSNLLKLPVIDEEGNPLKGKSIYSPEDFERLMMADAQSILALSEQVEDLTLFGPLEMVHLGKNMAKKFAHLKVNTLQLAHDLEALFLRVNYSLPYETLQASLEIKTANEQTFLVANYIPEKNWILKKYDLLCFSQDEDILLITNKNLNTILPAIWELVDEYTIVAPRLAESEFNQLFLKAKELEEKI